MAYWPFWCIQESDDASIASSSSLQSIWMRYESFITIRRSEKCPWAVYWGSLLEFNTDWRNDILMAWEGPSVRKPTTIFGSIVMRYPSEVSNEIGRTLVTCSKLNVNNCKSDSTLNLAYSFPNAKDAAYRTHHIFMGFLESRIDVTLTLWSAHPACKISLF